MGKDYGSDTNRNSIAKPFMSWWLRNPSVSVAKSVDGFVLFYAELIFGVEKNCEVKFI